MSGYKNTFCNNTVMNKESNNSSFGMSRRSVPDARESSHRIKS